MAKKIIFIAAYINLITLNLVVAECAFEEKLTYNQALTLSLNSAKLFVQNKDRFYKLNRPYQGKRTVQYFLNDGHDLHKNMTRYDDIYVKYYQPQRMSEYINSIRSKLKIAGYIVKTIGESIEGRPLYAIYPKHFNPLAKKVLMFGRHHGDEGTANWIIEGFVDKVFSQSTDWLKRFDLILYPMVNPDGAHHQVRYNRKSRDLNRVWGLQSSQSLDEVKIIHSHLDTLVADHSDLSLVLDMHGSFYEDFIYRVYKDFSGLDFYQEQQLFIDQLSAHDSWQGGDYKNSNGHPQMARIRFARDFRVNAMTHETIRNIPLNSGRNIQDLKEQGIAIETVIRELY